VCARAQPFYESKYLELAGDRVAGGQSSLILSVLANRC